MANPIAVPGTSVPSGAAVSPGGAQGPSAVSANANNKATLGTDSLVLVQGTAAGVAATTHAQTVSGDDPQLTTLASASTKGLLNQTSGNTTDFIDGTNSSQPLQPVIWSARLRSFNAIGNPTFEVDQRNVNASQPYAAGSVTQMQCDRWNVLKNAATAVISAGCANNQAVIVPGTNFRLTGSGLSLSVATPQATLAPAEYLLIRQLVEGPRWRELASDVNSISLLINSTIALNFAISIRDFPATHSLVKKVSTAAGVTSLITLPNLPLWPAGSNWSQNPGVVGYQISICLGTGTTSQAAALDVWQAANVYGFAGQDTGAANNFMATASAIVTVSFVQHEPGPLCTTPIDCPFPQNYDDCLRYYQKTYAYPTIAGTVTGVGLRTCISPTVAAGFGPASFLKPMAKIPTLTLYNHATGAANSVRDGSGVDHASASAQNIGDSGFPNIAFTTATTGVTATYFHYTADTGW